MATLPCQPDLGLWQRREIAVVNGPGFNASAWWAQFVELNTFGRGGASSTGQGETLFFRTTLVNQYYPLPWYLNPDAPWKRPNLTRGGSRPAPLIGTYAMNFPEEAPMTQASKFLEAMFIVIYVSCGIFGLAATAFFCQRKKCAESYLNVWIILHLLCYNPITMMGWGAVCHWGEHRFCLVSKTAAEVLFFAGWIGIGGAIVILLLLRCWCK